MDEKTRSLLIIFYKNPKHGMVKTRLAATVGNSKALSVYQQLALHTKSITATLGMEKIVFYSDAIDLMDIWPNATYLKAIQQGEDLGERMKNAFIAGFETGYTSICIIGTDCFELSEQIIRHAFESLQSSDAVIGPALDGGYYLLGMKEAHPVIFENKEWSTDTVLRDTIADFKTLQLNYVKMQELRDVDTENDLPEQMGE